MKTIPYWTDNTPFPAHIQLSELPCEVDVAVVGSGFTGLNAALALLKAGLSVAVLEKETIGWGASSRNGGIFGPGLFLSVDVLESRYGKERAKAFWRWSVEACDYVENVITSENIECDFDRSGEILLAYKPSHFKSIIEYQEYLEKEYESNHTSLLDANELEQELGSNSYYGGMLEQAAGGLDPAKYVYGLASVVNRQGGQLFQYAQVLGIKRENGRFVLSTSKGEAKARQVLLATNGYTGNLVRKIRYGIYSGACYSIVTEPLSPEKQEEISPNGRVFYDSKYFLNYFRMTADGRVLLGGRNTLVPGHDLYKSAHELQERLLEIFPQLEGIHISHSWSGRLGLTFDQMPHVGNEGGIHYAYGYFGHGIIIGSYLGYEVGQLIVGQRQGSLFMEIKHPRYFVSPWEKVYLPLVCAGFRLKDKIS